MSDFTLEKVDVSGFRGFTAKQEIELGHPVTLFSGGNRRGKSSILNAVEWCIFGSQVALIKYGDIRERDNWEVKNLRSTECSVQCEFSSKSSGKKLVVRRSLRGTKRTSEFSFQFDGGPKSSDEGALQVLLNISPTDFVRAVHLHQEVIRSLITVRSGERKEAIDRLLGLSDLREAAKSLQDQKPKAWTDGLDSMQNELSTRLQVALREKKNSTDRLTEELKAAGLEESEFSFDGAIRFVTNLVERMKTFAVQYHLPAPPLVAPADFTGLRELLGNLPPKITALRNQNPVLQNQGDQLTLKTRLEGIKQNYVKQSQLLADAQKKIKDLPADQQDVGALDQRIKEQKEEISRVDAEMGEVDAKAKVLSSTLDYFKERKAEDPLTCPVCGATSKTVAEWHEHIKSEIAKRHSQPLQERKDMVQQILRSSETARRSLLQLQESVSSEGSSLAAIKTVIAGQLNRVLKEEDDPGVLLTSKVDEITKALKELEQQVASVNSSLEGFDTLSRVLDKLVAIARTKKDIEQIEQITGTQSYKSLKAIRQKCEQYVEDVELLIEGIRLVTQMQADKRLSGAQNAISQIFTMLTARPDFPDLKVTSKGDGYVVEVTDSDHCYEALPLLNQADLNCAALSIFLALATAPDVAHKFGFIILDDPSQSLDSSSKGNLSKVLADACDKRQVIIGTSDDEFRDELLKIAKSKKHYLFKAWDHVHGPDIEQQKM